MDLRVLGPLEVRRDGVVLPVRRGRPRRLLLALLLRRGGAVAPETLLDQLWGEGRAGAAGNALHVLVSYLRRTVGGEDLRIERAPAGYRLVVDRAAVDMERFEELVAAGSSGADAASRLRHAETALALWRGPALLEAAEDDFARPAVVRLDELRLQAQELRASALLELGRHERALPELTALAAEQPFRERLQGQLALALYRSHRQAEALQVLAGVRHRLREELGVDPGVDLRRLETAVLRQDPALDLGAAPAGTGATEPAEPAEPAEAVVVAPGDPDEPVRAPVPLAPIVGRTEELVALADSLASRRLVTLAGPGGVGKTRVALEWAGTAGGTLWWADLSGVRESTALIGAVAAAAGTGVASSDGAAGELVRWVGRRDAVLVLDTCEHLLAASRALVEELLTGCPGLRVLATSRHALQVPGEVVLPLQPLGVDGAADGSAAGALPPAVRLFADRAAAVRPGFVVDDANVRDVMEVCRLLDGLPLAIELAAGHVAALTPRTIAGLLVDRLRLVGDGRERDGRHAGLRATIDWSYSLLTPDQALFLDRLSVFAGPFLADAAVEVAGEDLPGDGLALLLGLVRSSLVSADGGDHFRLLDTVRAYAADHLAARPGEPEVTRDRHAAVLARFSEEADRQIRGPDQPGWLAELRASAADLRAALRHCLDGTGRQAVVGARLVAALAWFWSHEGSFAEARGWIERALSEGPYDALLTGRLHLAAGMHAESVGDLAAASAHCELARSRFISLGDARGEARTLVHLGTVHWARGRLADAAEAHDRSVTLYRSVRDDPGAGLALVLRARTALAAGDLELASRLLSYAYHVLLRAGDEHLVGLCLEQQARTHLAVGDLDGARARAQEALAVFEGIGYAEGVGAALQTLGRVRLASGESAAALVLLERGARLAVEMAHAGAAVEAFELLAEAVASAGDRRFAAVLAGRAAAVRDEASVPPNGARSERLRRLLAGHEDELPGTVEVALQEGRQRTAEDLLDEVASLSGTAATPSDPVRGPGGYRRASAAPAARGR